MVQEYTQYTFNLPDGKQSIQTAATLEEAKQEALGFYRRNGYDVPDLSNFTEKPADAGYYMATRKPVPSGVLMGGQDVQRNTQSLRNMGYTIEDGRVFAPVMAPPQQVEQQMPEPPQPFVEPAAPTPPPAPTPTPTPCRDCFESDRGRISACQLHTGCCYPACCFELHTGHGPRSKGRS